MIAYFYIPRVSNDMKIAVQKNNLWGQIWYRSWPLLKKRRHNNNFILFDLYQFETVFVSCISSLYDSGQWLTKICSLPTIWILIEILISCKI